MSNSDSGVNKVSVGLVALVCLTAAAGLYLFAPEQDGMLAGFWRVGLVMFALWLALPAKGETFAGMKALPIVAGALVLVAARGKALLILFPLVAAIGVVVVLLRPKPKRRHPPSGTP